MILSCLDMVEWILESYNRKLMKIVDMQFGLRSVLHQHAS